MGTSRARFRLYSLKFEAGAFSEVHIRDAAQKPHAALELPLCLGPSGRGGSEDERMRAVVLRMLVVTLVLASGFALHRAWEGMANPTVALLAQAQTDLYDCDDFASQVAAQQVYKDRKSVV